MQTLNKKFKKFENEIRDLKTELKTIESKLNNALLTSNFNLQLVYRGV